MPKKKISKKISAKQIKASTASAKKSTKLTAKQLKATAKMLSQEKQLRAIEKLLDEEFDNLAQAKRELKKNTVQVKRTTKTAIRQTREITRAFVDAFSSPTSSKRKPTKAQKPAPQPKKKTPQRTPSKVVVPKKAASKLPSVSQPVKKRTGKRIQTQGKLFSISRIKARKGETLIEYFERLRSQEDEIDDRLAKDGVGFTFTYAGGKSKKAWPSLKLALAQMSEYKLSEAVISGDIEPEDEPWNPENLAQSISFIKFNGSYSGYEQMRHEETEARKEERRQIRRKAKAILGESDQTGSNIELVRKLTEEVERLKGKKK